MLLERMQLLDRLIDRERASVDFHHHRDSVSV
jgi:hypothetical protein